MPAVAEVQFKATNSQTVVTAFNTVGTAAQNASTKIGQFTAAATTKVQQFTSSLQSIKSQGDPFANLTNNLGSFNKSVDQSSQKATSFGQKLKGFGSQFGSSIATIGTLSGTILSLSRQYQDLSDSQIRVDRTQLKVSKTTEATGVAQGKLNALVAKGITSGAEYDAALLNVKQALEAQDLAQRNLVEAQEDHQRAQENFWIGLVPTVTSAGASIISVLNDIGGTKGLGGLKTALGGLKTAFTGFTGLSTLATGITGIGTAAEGSVVGVNGMSKATVGLGAAMKATALSMLPVALALGGVALTTKAAGMVIHEIISIMKGDMLEAVKSIQSLIDFYTKIGSVIPMGAGFAIFTALKPEVEKLRAELEKVPQTIKPVSAELQHMDDIGQGMSGTIDNIIGGVLGLTKKADAATPALNNTGGAITGIGTSASTAAPAVTGLNKGLGVMKFPTADAAVFDTYIKNWGSQTIPQATKSVMALNPQLEFLTGWLNAAVQSTNAFAASTAKAKQQAAQLAPVLAKATAAFQHLTVAQGGAAKGVRPNQPQFGPLHGNPVPGAANPNFRRQPNYQKAKIVKPKQHGYQSTVHRPTMFIAGEGGRPEDVTVRPRGSVQRGGSSGGGFNGTINVYVDGVLRPARYDMGARK